MKPILSTDNPEGLDSGLDSSSSAPDTPGLTANHEPSDAASSAEVGSGLEPNPEQQPGVANGAPVTGSAGSGESLLAELRHKYPDALPFHPLANLFPFPSGEEFYRLVEDIRSNGLRVEISLVDGQVFDGRSRYLACLEAGVEPAFELWVGSGNLLKDVISLNLIRRHLNESQRALVAAKMVPHLQEEIAKEKAASNPEQNRANLRGTKKVAVAAAAKWMNVGARTVEHAEGVLASNRPDLVAQIEAGKLAASEAEAVARKSVAKNVPKKPKQVGAKAGSELKNAGTSKETTVDAKELQSAHQDSNITATELMSQAAPEPELVPAPESMDDYIESLSRYLAQLDETERRSEMEKLMSWLQAKLLDSPSVTLP